MNRVEANAGPAAVDRYLLPRETREAMTRRHPAVLIAPSAQAIGGLLVAAVLSATLLRGSGHALLRNIVWALWGVLLFRLVWDVVNWYVDYFVITSQRILLTSGIFTRSVAMMPLSKVTDMSFHRSFAGRLLGYGEFVVESAGQDQALRKIDHIPYPEQLYQIVCGKIFKDAVGQDDGTGSIGPPDDTLPETGPDPDRPSDPLEDNASLLRANADLLRTNANLLMSTSNALTVNAEALRDYTMSYTEVVEGEVVEADTTHMDVIGPDDGRLD